MAKKERSGLGRGLGALLPAAEQGIVSRETISNAHPLDSLVPAVEGTTPSGNREYADVTRKLLAPDTTKRRRGKASGKATAKTASKPAKTAANKATAEASSKSTSAPVAKSGTKTSNKSAAATTTTKAGSKKKLFADIIGDSETPTGDTQTAQKQSGAGKTRNAQASVPESAGPVSETEQTNLVPVPGATFAEIDIDAVVPNRRQPREVFDEDELAELAESVKEIGVLQPIVVRPLLAEEYEDYLAELGKRLDSDSIEELGLSVDANANPEQMRFELVMGERRLRASKLAESDTIPAIVRFTSDTDMLRDALLENLHRSQLNPIEEAAAYQQLLQDFDCTQQELSERIARSRSQIANTIRLLRLPASVQRKLAAGVISAGHARALLGLESTGQMSALAERIVAEGLSVRSTEEIVTLGEVEDTPARRRASKRAVAPQSQTAQIVTNRLEDLFETRVKVQEGKRKGRIVIEFAGAEDLDRLAAVITALRS
ncbi:MAG: ParB/RepB/Spo0J family partition protein [Actinomycetaceae bacterium]|nr:ParB/RepB/Spo0J family partition protein [Actinomycetaceae bacterium]